MSDLTPSKPKLFNTDSTTRLAWSAFRRWRPPIWLQLSVMALVVASWIPIAVAIEWRTDMSKEQPRVHFIQDMDNQTKYKAQAESVLFNDGRAQLPARAGHNPLGELNADAALFTGFTESAQGGNAGSNSARSFVNEFPPAIQERFNVPEQAQKFLALGQQKFNITCAICHGSDGQGNGPIAQRAASTGAGATGWVQPTNITDEIRRGRPDGHLYNTINVGIRKMAGYGTQLSPEERWAVVAYVRTLQMAQASPKNVLTPEQQRALQ